MITKQEQFKAFHEIMEQMRHYMQAANEVRGDAEAFTYMMALAHQCRRDAIKTIGYGIDE